MITPSVQADLETLHQSLTDIRKQLPLEANRLENDRIFDAITRDLTRVVSLVMRIDIAVATSLHGVLAADREQVRAELKADIEQVRADLTLKIEQVRVEVARTG